MNRYLATAILFMLMSGNAFASATAAPSDLPPPEVVAKVLESNPVVQSARSGIDLGRAQKRKLDSGPYEFNVNTAGQQRNSKPADKRYAEWNVGLDRPFRVPGKAGIDSDIGNAVVQASRFAYGAAYREVARELLTQWFNWVKANSEVTQWQSQVELLYKQREVVAKREKVGDAAKLETSIAESAYAQANASLKIAESRVQISASALLQSYPGLQLPATVELSEPQPVEGSLEEWITKALSSSHERDRAKAEALQVKLQAERARLDLIPDPTVGVFYGSEQGGGEQLMGIRLAIPLPGSTARSADLAAARAESSIAAQREALANRNILNNMATVYATAASGYHSWQSARIAMEGIEQNSAKMARAYELGEVGLTDLLNAQRLKAESALISNTTRIETIEAYYRLLLDSGQLWLPQDGIADKHKAHIEETPTGKTTPTITP